jgi:hypothetical protein
MKLSGFTGDCVGLREYQWTVNETICVWFWLALLPDGEAAALAVIVIWYVWLGFEFDADDPDPPHPARLNIVTNNAAANENGANGFSRNRFQPQRRNRPPISTISQKTFIGIIRRLPQFLPGKSGAAA